MAICPAVHYHIKLHLDSPYCPGLVGDLARIELIVLLESSVLPGGVETNARLFMMATLLLPSLDFMLLCH